ncbi:hypothetical protein F3Y22_tig00111463pilonHSYRG00129 [Hibiscus syriacus]|uniref:Reverse transcriptase Ty1/copia-type domain-containing protein n=1 Tax=Hibiscus syriacus TaxID=106335 RepID=A0A6A2XQK9_HIBSY|nr:hypothetical protein F3Y22_tig00111463pilonHSYRG00129 [Hibiscus syriacus]
MKPDKSLPTPMLAHLVAISSNSKTILKILPKALMKIISLSLILSMAVIPLSLLMNSMRNSSIKNCHSATRQGPHLYRHQFISPMFALLMVRYQWTPRLPGFTSIPTQDITRSSPSNTRDNRSPARTFLGFCQWCSTQGHVVSRCPFFRQQFLNAQPPPHPNNSSQYRPLSPRQSQAKVATTHPSNTTWLHDSSASHHVTTDLNNLSLHGPYDGIDEIMIGDGSGLPISHTGFHQHPRVDYSETFSPVIKPTTLRLVLSLEVGQGWSLRQLDINNAFLQGTLTEDVFMSQPPGIIDRGHPYHVCKLLKAIYGLKQAPVLEVTSHNNGLFLSQRKYIVDLLNKTHMTEAKPAPTPLATSPTLTLQSGTTLSDLTEYRTIVGSLQYLSLTRPDVAYTVNKLSQFIARHHTPSTSPLALHAFSDVDWAGNKDDFTSTSAYIVYLGHNPISWSSKKHIVARSSTEAEYRSVASIATEIRWICSLLTELAFDYYFIREQVQNGLLRVSHISATDQLVDALTKPLAVLSLTLLPKSTHHFSSRFSLLRQAVHVTACPNRSIAIVRPKPTRPIIKSLCRPSWKRVRKIDKNLATSQFFKIFDHHDRSLASPMSPMYSPVTSLVLSDCRCGNRSTAPTPSLSHVPPRTGSARGAHSPALVSSRTGPAGLNPPAQPKPV